MSRVLFDADWIRYGAGFASEDRTIIVTHKNTLEQHIFKNRTEFFGSKSSEIGGWLGELNETRISPYQKDEWMIEDIQTPKPFNTVELIVDTMVSSTLSRLGCKNYYGYIGKGKCFREDISTALKYKGNREDNLKPVHINYIEQYLLKRHHCKLVTGIEADDACSIDSYSSFQEWKKTKHERDRLILVAVDKDAKGTTCHLFNPDKSKLPQTIQGYGKLFKNDEGKWDGWGRVWLYYQIIEGDASDNYKPIYLAKQIVRTDKPIGVAKVVTALAACTNDKEALQVVVDTYKQWYPQEFSYVSWKGDSLTGTWLSMLQEHWTLAHMLRWPDDKVDVADVLTKLGIKGDTNV